MTVSELLPSLCAMVLAAVLSACMIWAIRPLLLRHALAKPNARSSHRVPTPQGAGIAVVAATLLVAAAVNVVAVGPAANIPLVVFGTTLFIAIVGFIDDVKSIGVLPRLLLQGLAVGAVVFAAPDNLRIVSACPPWIERGLLVIAGLWFVNLVNFMDGLDLMTVAEAVPVSAAVALFGLAGNIPAATTVAAAALCGALLGFAPFNRPVAKIFLGDVGSLPIGLLLGWCLLQLAYHGQNAVAPNGEARAVLGGASIAFLSAGNGQRLHRVARGRRSLRAQCRSRVAGDDLDQAEFGRSRRAVAADRSCGGHPAPAQILTAAACLNRSWPIRIQADATPAASPHRG